MAEKRMFAKSIVLSDAFLDMPMSSRCLYFTLGMFADDDGFVGSPKGIMRQCGATQDDMQLLIAKKFVLDFDSGVIVIKHWRINNYLRGDRHHDTTYTDELSQLAIDEKGAYTMAGIPNGNQVSTNCQPAGIPSIDKIRIDKNSIDKCSRSASTPPPISDEYTSYPELSQEVIDLVLDKWNGIPHTDKMDHLSYGTSRYNELRISIGMYGLDYVLSAIDKVAESSYLAQRGMKAAFSRYMNRNTIEELNEGSFDMTYEEAKRERNKSQNDEVYKKLEEWANNG